MKRLLTVCVLLFALVAVYAESDFSSETEEAEASSQSATSNDESEESTDSEEDSEEDNDNEESTDVLEQQVNAAISEAANTLKTNPTDSSEPKDTSWVNEVRHAQKNLARHSWRVRYKQARFHQIARRHKYITSLLGHIAVLHHKLLKNKLSHRHFNLHRKWRMVQEKVLRSLVRITRDIADKCTEIYRMMRHEWSLNRPKGWLHNLFWDAGKYMRLKLKTVVKASFRVHGRAGRYLRHKLDELTRHLRRDFSDAEDADADFMETEIKDEQDPIVVLHHLHLSALPASHRRHRSNRRWKMRMEGLREDLKESFDAINGNMSRMFRFIQSRIAFRKKTAAKLKIKMKKYMRRTKQQHRRVRKLFHSIGKFIQKLYHRVNVREKHRAEDMEEKRRRRKEKKRARKWAARKKRWNNTRKSRMREWQMIARQHDNEFQHAREMSTLRNRLRKEKMAHMLAHRLMHHTQHPHDVHVHVNTAPVPSLPSWLEEHHILIGDE